MTFRARIAATCVAVGLLAGAPRAADYPLSVVALAWLKSGSTAITSTVVMRVKRLMEESRRPRVSDALRYTG